jgi:hypothetical protein
MITKYIIDRQSAKVKALCALRGGKEYSLKIFKYGFINSLTYSLGYFIIIWIKIFGIFIIFAEKCGRRKGSAEAD